jgi:hypothetical protein
MTLWITGTVDRETLSNAIVSATGSFSPHEAVSFDGLTDEEKLGIYDSVYRNDW